MNVFGVNGAGSAGCDEQGIDQASFRQGVLNPGRGDSQSQGFCFRSGYEKDLDPVWGSNDEAEMIME
jgi:hypothetical protein